MFWPFSAASINTGSPIWPEAFGLAPFWMSISAIFSNPKKWDAVKFNFFWWFYMVGIVTFIQSYAQCSIFVVVDNINVCTIFNEQFNNIFISCVSLNWNRLVRSCNWNRFIYHYLFQLRLAMLSFHLCPQNLCWNHE